MSRRTLLTQFTAALALATLAAVAPASAVEIGNANFNLTFPSGWSKLSYGQSDSVTVIAMKDTGGAYLSGFPHQGALTQAEIAAYMAAYGANDSLTITAQGNKTLGGKQFTFLEFKQANPADSSEAISRFRIYYFSQGNFLFQAITVYDFGADGGVIADLESALATLKITAVAGLRTVAGYVRPEFHRADHDVLGRFHATDIRRVPLFRLPAL